jgi:outer membrane biosynthesis protein TonB
LSAAATAAPSQSLLRRNLNLTWAIAGSLAVHVGILFFFIALSFFEPPKLPLSQKPVSAKLVRLGKERDKNLLPRKEVNAPPPPNQVEIPGLKPVAIKAKDPRPKAAPDPKATQQRRKSLFDAFTKVQANAKPEELAGSPDGSPEGDSDTADEGEQYFGLILAKTRRYYSVSTTIPPNERIRLKAVVVLYINASGELIKDPAIDTSSGNEQFDSDVIQSIKKAAPFGPPPKHLLEILKGVGVSVIATPL